MERWERMVEEAREQERRDKARLEEKLKTGHEGSPAPPARDPRLECHTHGQTDPPPASTTHAGTST